MVTHTQLVTRQQKLMIVGELILSLIAGLTLLKLIVMIKVETFAGRPSATNTVTGAVPRISYCLSDPR